MKQNKSLLFLAVLTVFTSCSSLKHSSKIPEPINYSDEEIVQVEIERIYEMIPMEPVRAMWRAYLLGREEVFNRTKKNVELLFEKSIDEKEYFEAKKYYKSLTSIGWKSEKYTYKEIENICAQDIPGLRKNKGQLPKNLTDCMNATVTIWLDRGLKVQNGAGYADIVIGSGFFIDDRGYIVTNHHVIESMVDPKYEGYSRLYIKLLEDPDTRIPAKVIGYDSVLDLALLKVEVTPKYVLNLGSSSDLQIGDKVSAIGTPVGLEGTLTSGIISSTERKLFTLGNVFQIDAAVNSGNSGGPLIDQNMNVQAIVFAGMIRYQGLNFAIPVEYLRQELNLMYSSGEVIHPWIACYGHTKRSGKKKTGVEIQYVLPGGSAFVNNLKPGDVITSVDGIPVNSIEDFHFLMMAYEPETLLPCKYVDENQNEKEILIYLERRPDKPNLTVYESDLVCNAFVPLFGMKLIGSSTLSRNSYTIEKIIRGGTADEMSFSEHDAVTVKTVKVNKEEEYIAAQIYTKRRKKGFLDVTLVLGTSFDNPYYF